MSAALQPISYQQGGIMDSFQILMSNMDSPAKLLYGFVLVLVIAYSAQIPTEYRVFADSLLGRVFGLAVLYGVIHTLGWVRFTHRPSICTDPPTCSSYQSLSGRI
jgi:4-hydroxybenzoate polyprenyltransferase